ncbi:MAG TPA: HD domain-containing phosphohydrolase [Chthonomonadales bacterium]|nr:HD domain-containing phosphohydrolase [Chthonomonadales bacterium]
MAEPAAGPLSVPTAATASELRSCAHILVVDDEAWVRDLLHTSLSCSGYCVSAVPSAEQALAFLQRQDCDLVLSDVRMDGMDGLALSRALRASHPHIPVVLLTGHAHVELARTALQQGAADFITKPFAVGALPIVIERNLERARIERHRAQQDGERTMLQSVRMLAATIDAKQRCTARHSERVTVLAAAVGEAMSLPLAEQRTLDMAARVHDVGKIGVPDCVLNKGGALDDLEWESVRSHPVTGHSIVKAVPQLECVASIVRHHHERFDGDGYPDGLCGDEIPLLARIITVADAYEAMTSERPYRPVLSPAAACAQLTEHAGTQFDPDIVDIFRSAVVVETRGRAVACRSRVVVRLPA